MENRQMIMDIDYLRSCTRPQENHTAYQYQPREAFKGLKYPATRLVRIVEESKVLNV